MTISLDVFFILLIGVLCGAVKKDWVLMAAFLLWGFCKLFLK